MSSSCTLKIRESCRPGGARALFYELTFKIHISGDSRDGREPIVFTLCVYFRLDAAPSFPSCLVTSAPRLDYQWSITPVVALDSRYENALGMLSLCFLLSTLPQLTRPLSLCISFFHYVSMCIFCRIWPRRSTSLKTFSLLEFHTTLHFSI